MSLQRQQTVVTCSEYAEGRDDSPADMDLLKLTFRSFTIRETEEETFVQNEEVEEITVERTVEVTDVKITKLEKSRRKDRNNADNENDLPIISLDEIAWHDSANDCWFTIYDYVYDGTEFLRNHPGGEDIILEYAGRDATLAFVGTGHSKMAKKILERYLIGELPLSERIFRVPGGLQITNHL